MLLACEQVRPKRLRARLIILMECSEFVKYRFGYDDSRAAAIASVAQVLPIFLMPLLGVFVDRYGKRIVLSKSA